MQENAESVVPRCKDCEHLIEMDPVAKTWVHKDGWDDGEREGEELDANHTAQYDGTAS